MTNNAKYQQFKEIVENYNTEELRAMTYQQARALLNERFTLSFWKNMKIAAMCYLTDKSDDAVKTALRGELVGGKRVWLDNNFPDVVFESGREMGKRKITIWLDGK